MGFWLLPWADTRPLAGEYAYSTSVTWVGGIFPSWAHATYKTTYFASGLSQDYFPSWSGYLYRHSNWNCVGVRPNTSSTTIISNDYLVDSGVVQNNTYTVFEGICPMRNLEKDPTAIDRVDGGVVVTLSGITYRTTHSNRRHWQFDLLLDGPLDGQKYPNSYPDTRKFWPKFLKTIEKGVTWFSDSAQSNQWQYRLPNDLGLTSVDNIIPYGSPYVGCPKMITGQVTDCTTTSWQAGAGDKMARLRATITVAEVMPPGRLP